MLPFNLQQEIFIMANNQYCKSTLSAYNNTSTALDVGALMPINNNARITGCSISHVSGSNAIRLLKKGLYLVAFSASGSYTSTAGAVSLQLYRNGVAVPTGIVTQTPTATTDIESFSTATIVEVKEVCPCAGTGTQSIDLTFANTGVAATYTYFNVSVVKLA